MNQKSLKTPLRILIVEDSEADTALIIHELRSHGYEPAYERVETEADMGAALDSADWDIVVADYAMPQFSGTAALSLLKERGLDLPSSFAREASVSQSRSRP